MWRQRPGGSGWVHLALQFTRTQWFVYPAEANACFYPGGQFFIRANLFLDFHYVLLHSELITSAHLSALIRLELN